MVAHILPVTRGELSQFFGIEVSRDTIAAGPRSPQPGAPHAYVTTPAFLGKSGRKVRLDQSSSNAETPRGFN